jgi:hypothetical protein
MTEARWRAKLRAAAPLLVLATLPLVLLSFNDTWIWDSPSYSDTNIYVGFFRHYLEFRHPFIDNYKSSRLPFVLPGVLLYRLLPPPLAHHVLFLAFLTGGALSLFLVARRRFGAPAAFAAAAALSVFTYSHTAPSYHNQAATAYFLSSIALVHMPGRLPVHRRAMLAGAVFAFAFNTDSIVLGLAPAFAVQLGTARPSESEAHASMSSLQRLGIRAAAALLGVLSSMAALGAVNAVLGGPFLFFMDQVRMSIHLARKGELSHVGLSEIATHLGNFPWLVLPLVTAVGCTVVLATHVARREFGARRTDEFACSRTTDAACFLLALGAAIAMQVRGLSILEMPHLFHPFFAPMFLALAGLLGDDRVEGKRRAPIAFLGGVAAFLLFPLCLIGTPLSRLLVNLARTWPAAAHGVPLSLGLAAACGAALRWAPLTASARAVCAGAAFGLINALSPAPRQRAYLYQVGDRCTFRREVFLALIGADESISAFDPANEARSVYGGIGDNEERFDVRGGCGQLPVGAAVRDLLLTHYFYTSAEFVDGYKAPAAPPKVVIVAVDPDQADVLVDYFLGDQPAGTTVNMGFERRFQYSTFAAVVRGYEVAHHRN